MVEVSHSGVLLVHSVAALMLEVPAVLEVLEVREVVDLVFRVLLLRRTPLRPLGEGQPVQVNHCDSLRGGSFEVPLLPLSALAFVMTMLLLLQAWMLLRTPQGQFPRRGGLRKA